MAAVGITLLVVLLVGLAAPLVLYRRFKASASGSDGNHRFP